MSRNLCHKSSPIPLWNLTDSQIVTNGSWQKPIRTLSDLKIVTNGAWQKTYPKFFGLENCHKWGVTKNLSDICRTWFVSRSANLTQLVGPNCVTAWVRLFFRASKKFKYRLNSFGLAQAKIFLSRVTKKCHEICATKAVRSHFGT